MTNLDAPIRRDDDMLFGRLVAIPSSHTVEQLKAAIEKRGLKEAISIDFPAMPDAIELVRQTEYYMNTNPMMPDGIHQYKGTRPLEIPISFKLHAFDTQFCNQHGALTLLQLAARLHAFVIPISTFQGEYSIMPVAEEPKTDSGKPNTAQVEYDSQKLNMYEVHGSSATGAIYPPVTCWLHLMWTGDKQPGISCIGYVRDVKVQFSGPWLRGPDESFNLPSWAEYSFTFVHRPGHTNFFGAAVRTVFPSVVPNDSQAFADDVRKNLYNTRHLIRSDAKFQGFVVSELDRQKPEELTVPPLPDKPKEATVFEEMIKDVSQSTSVNRWSYYKFHSMR